MRFSRSFAAALAMFGTVMIACSDDTSSTTTLAPVTTTLAATTTTPTPSTTVVSSTRAATTTTVVAPEDIPLPETVDLIPQSDEDWRLIVQELFDFIEWLEAHPDPEFVDYVSVPDSQHEAAFRQRITGYVNDGVRQGDDESSEVIAAAEILRPTDTQAIIDVVSDSSATIVYDTDGNVVEEQADPAAVTYSLLLEFDDEFGWRIVQLTILGDEG